MTLIEIFIMFHNSKFNLPNTFLQIPSKLNIFSLFMSFKYLQIYQTFLQLLSMNTY